MKKENNFEAIGKSGFVREPIWVQRDCSEENDSEKDEEKDALSKLLQILLKAGTREL